MSLLRTVRSLTGALVEDSRVLRSLVDPTRIGYLIAYVSDNCNFSCPFCFHHGKGSPSSPDDPLSVSDYEAVARSLGGLVQLSLTGGEPFMRRDLAEISTALLTHTGARYVTIPTNGWFTDRICRFVDDLLPAFPRTSFRIVLSIEGISEEHDRIRERSGSWARLKQTYAALESRRRSSCNLILDANSVFTNRSRTNLLTTLQHLDQHFDFDNLGVNYIRGDVRDPAMHTRDLDGYRRIQQFLRIRSRRRDARRLSEVWRAIDDQTYERVLETILADDAVLPCVAGRKLVVLGASGELYPCELLGRSMGNVRDFHLDLPALLSGAEASAVRSTIRATRCHCSFECAQAASILWSGLGYPRLAGAMLRGLVRQVRQSGKPGAS